MKSCWPCSAYRLPAVDLTELRGPAQMRLDLTAGENLEASEARARRTRRYQPEPPTGSRPLALATGPCRPPRSASPPCHRRNRTQRPDMNLRSTANSVGTNALSCRCTDVRSRPVRRLACRRIRVQLHQQAASHGVCSRRASGDSGDSGSCGAPIVAARRPWSIPGPAIGDKPDTDITCASCGATRSTAAKRTSLGRSHRAGGLSAAD